MPTITVHVTLPPMALLQPGKARAILTQEVGQGMTTVVEAIATAARARTPVGVSGLLRASIATTVARGEDASSIVRGEIFTGAQAPYALFVEEGTPPGHFPPWREGSSLHLWSQRVLGNGNLAYLVARAIFRRGTKGVHFMRDAMAQVEPTILPTLQAAADRAAQRWQEAG